MASHSSAAMPVVTPVRRGSPACSRATNHIDASRTCSARTTEQHSQVLHSSVVYCNDTPKLLSNGLLIYSNMMLQNSDEPFVPMQHAITTSSNTTTDANPAGTIMKQPHFIFFFNMITISSSNMLKKMVRPKVTR